jgi:hypothetical protein
MVDFVSPPSKHVNIDGFILVSSTTDSSAPVSAPLLRGSEALACGLALAFGLALPFAPAFDLAFPFVPALDFGLGSGDSEHGLGLNSELACEGLINKIFLAGIASKLGGFARSFEPSCVLQVGVV